MPGRHARRFASAGEALVDLIEGDSGDPTARPGGSPFNVAVGLARLGLDTSFAGRLSIDAHGQLLHDRLAAEGIGESLLQWGAEPTAVAVVGRVGDEAVYDFRWTGTADRGYDPAGVSRDAWARLDVLHLGSAALGLEPVGGRSIELMERLSGTVLLSFDPNVRRDVVDVWPTYLDRVQRAVGLADLVKASEADLRELGADMRSDGAPMGRTGPTVVTRGAGGATLYRAGWPPIDVPAPTVEVVDTIGAGDAFTAGLLFALDEYAGEDLRRLGALPDDAWREILRVATTAGAMTCERVGADPPTAAELRARLSA
jgi:fructokinase